MYIVVGLGNPDKKYLNTLHNCGFKVLDKLALDLDFYFTKKGFKSVYAEKIINGEKVLFVKPLTYMNLSGECVKELINFYKLSTSNLMIIYDDLDLNIGSIRIRPSGSAGTHNGMRNIVSQINSTDFPRIRIGIKPKIANYNIIDYVLSDIKKEDCEEFEGAFERAKEAVIDFLNGSSIDNIMCKYNG